MNSLKQEKQNETLLVTRLNFLISNLTTRLWVSEEEFNNYYLEVTKKFIKRELERVQQSTQYKINWSNVEDNICTHLRRNFFAWKIETVLSNNS